MNILEKEEQRPTFKLRIEDLDDLWYLYQIIRPGCILGSHTYRKLETMEDKIRPDSQPRVRVFLRIEVSTVEFHPFTDDLRVGGEIILGPEDISGHHTMNLGPGKTIELEFNILEKEDIDLLEEASSGSQRSKALAISLDDESADIFRIRNYGVQKIATVRSESGGKQYDGKGGWEGYYSMISETLQHHISKDLPVLIVGPGFFKEALAKVLRNESAVTPSNIHILPSSSGGVRGLNEALSKGKGMSKVIEDLRYQKETNAVNRLMEGIGKGKGATYGKKEVEEALSMGAVDLLLISESSFRKGWGRKLLSRCSEVGSKGMIISTSHEAGEILEKLGGAGALLRFEI